MAIPIMAECANMTAPRSYAIVVVVVGVVGVVVGVVVL
jgi:hypothetical protein